jgi:sodium/potassium-transporting ATPase subunit alpha
VLLEVSLILLITYTPWGNLLLGTAPLSVAVWLFLLPWALGMIALEELRKLLARRRLAIPKP